jgi:glucokinase
MILAGDIGGTKVNLGLFDSALAIIESRSFSSRAFSGLPDIIRAFLGDRAPTLSAMSFGAAGPVVNERCQVTNLDWAVDAPELRRAFGVERVFILNDLEANGTGVAHLPETAFHVLQPGVPRVGNAALISAGTGLGQCALFWDGRRHVAAPSEGGHATFAPRNEEDVALLRHLWTRYDHVSWERTLSGSFGFENIYTFLRDTGRAATSPDVEAEIAAAGYGPALVRLAEQNVEIAVKTLERFVALYGAEAGNLALKTMSVAGIFIGGGIAPKILPWLQAEAFLSAFTAKGRFRKFLEDIPVSVILEERTALFGAARYALIRLS